MQQITVLLFAAVLLTCLSGCALGRQVGLQDRSGRFLYKYETVDLSDGTCIACAAAEDMEECTNDDSCIKNKMDGLYCQDYGGTAGKRCTAKMGKGASCDKSNECASNKCHSFCASSHLIFKIVCYKQCAA